MTFLKIALSIIVVIGFFTALHMAMTLRTGKAIYNIVAALVVLLLFIILGVAPFLFIGAFGIASIQTKLQGKFKNEKPN